jgi:hypothetical protein
MAFLLAKDRAQDLEVWAVWDEAARVYELYTDPEGEGYVGEADTRPEAIQVARWWFNERANG